MNGDDDLFGAALTMVSGICDVAGPEQICVSNLVRDLGVDKRFSFDRARTESLKGFSEPTKTRTVGTARQNSHLPAECCLAQL